MLCCCLWWLSSGARRMLRPAERTAQPSVNRSERHPLHYSVHACAT